MKKMLANCDVEIITKYYDIEAIDSDGTIIMRRMRNYNDYKLKTKLRIPYGYFATKIATFS